LCVLWTYFRLPEPKGRTFSELDVLFERNISARHFSKTEVDPFEAHVNEKEAGLA
jgi:SP family general alpha glucoside:H+ symporter-like MFS transporter